MRESSALEHIRQSICCLGPSSRIEFNRGKDGTLKAARRAVTRGGIRVRSRVPNPKGPTSTPAESGHEKFAALLLSWLSSVALYAAQPFELVIATQCGELRRFPDFFARRTDASNWAIEVCTARSLESHEERDDLNLKSAHLANHGISLAVWDESIVGDPAWRRNIQGLARFRPHNHDVEIERRVRDFVATHGEVRLDQIPLSVTSGDMATVFSLIAKGLLWTDLNQKELSRALLQLSSTCKGASNEDHFFCSWR